jgi:hypothetical protein
MLWLATTPAAPRAELLFTGRELEMSDIHPFAYCAHRNPADKEPQPVLARTQTDDP